MYCLLAIMFIWGTYEFLLLSKLRKIERDVSNCRDMFDSLVDRVHQEMNIDIYSVPTDPKPGKVYTVLSKGKQ